MAMLGRWLFGGWSKGHFEKVVEKKVFVNTKTRDGIGVGNCAPDRGKFDGGDA